MTQTCSVPDCGKPVRTKGLCDPHYKRQLRHGDPQAGRESAGPNDKTQPCIVEGCSKLQYIKQMCNTHYLRVQRFGDPHHVVRIHGRSEEEKRELKRAAHKLDYEKNKDRYKANAERWRTENAERDRQNKIAYLSRADVKILARLRTKGWVQTNPERKRAMDEEFKAKNPALVRSYKAKRRAVVLQACPTWLTEDHHAQIKAFYDASDAMTKATGVRHEVDHIVPLQGRTVCGLHVPWNLRVIPARTNNQRPRIWDPEGDT